MSKLAIHGGIPTIRTRFKHFNSYDNAELNAAHNVIKSGNLSSFLGSWSENFYGGEQVLALESAFRSYFNVDHAISLNSWTSGLIAAVGAIGIEPGDEVILPPWTMCATATSIIHWGGIPIFADINSENFCIDPTSIEENITNKTRAIIAVDIFGAPADMSTINYIAAKHNLSVISDCAQSPGISTSDGYAGTLGDIGGFSLNYHKHIHTGEGGILVTNNSNLAERCKLIRNHAEAVVGPKGEKNIVNMIGYNFRLGEIEAALAIEQLKKLDLILERRSKVCKLLTESLADIEFLRLPPVSTDVSNAFYIYPIVLNTEKLDINRNKIVKALQAEGITGLMEGYANLHLLPMYQQKIAYGSMNFPWSHDSARKDITYNKGICPVAEYLHEYSFIGFLVCLYDLHENDIHMISNAFHKVFKNLDSLSY